MTEEPIKRSADGLSVGDRILAAYLPAVADETAEVVFAKPYTYVGEPWIFVAFQLPNGLIEATHYKADNGVEVYPADTGLSYSRADDGETTQPIAGRVPPHFGAVVSEGGHTAVEVAGGLIEIDPPEGYFIVPHGPVKPPYGSPEREAYDRERDHELRDEWTAMVNAERGWNDESTGLVSGGLVPNCPTCGGDHQTVEPCR